jgi:chemotaxis-related protein WspD
MSTAPVTPAPLLDCWNRIGISGDRSCPELSTHIHCRNCPVFESGARSFFERPAPEGYLDEWARALDAEVKPPDADDISLLVFRLGVEWLALPTKTVVEVTEPRPVHLVPHRSNEVVTGLINLRGRLQLQVSLHGLLGVARDEPPRAQPARHTAAVPRLVVIQGDGQTWVFTSDEVLGIHRFSRGKVSAVPSTLANPANSFSEAVIDWEGKSVGLLDRQRLFAALRRLGR